VKVLITAGPTREYLDDVRYLSNASTGRMGLALARAAAEAGHDVTVVHGPIAGPLPPLARVVPVTSAREMFDAVAAEFPACDALIACAAVSDYRPAERARGKIKRERSEELTVRLVRNPDSVREMAARRRAGQVVIGFALESADAEANALAKLSGKQLDAIVLNAATAIGAEATEITLFRADTDEREHVTGTKDTAARYVVRLAERLLAAKQP
jgi:phosphopantothenoylcysteine decarboxylase/phosphopantothenate--cysteine ligase